MITINNLNTGHTNSFVFVNHNTHIHMNSMFSSALFSQIQENKENKQTKFKSILIILSNTLTTGIDYKTELSICVCVCVNNLMMPIEKKEVETCRLAKIIIHERPNK